MQNVQVVIDNSLINDIAYCILDPVTSLACSQDMSGLAFGQAGLVATTAPAA